MALATRVIAEVVVDCPEPRALAEFYRAVLGWAYAPGHETDDPDGDEWLVLLPPGDHGGPDGGQAARLAFQRSDAPVPPWRDGAIVHLDLRVQNLEDASQEVRRLGARPLTEAPEGDYWVHADPVGHPFCLVVE